MCIRDSDTTASATRAVVIGRRQQINVIHGVEFSTMDTPRGKKAHLLCYLCDTPDRLEGLCRRISESRKKASMDMIRRVMRYYPIPLEIDVYKRQGIGRSKSRRLNPSAPLDLRPVPARF